MVEFKNSKCVSGCAASAGRATDGSLLVLVVVVMNRLHPPPESKMTQQLQTLTSALVSLLIQMANQTYQTTQETVTQKKLQSSPEPRKETDVLCGFLS